MKTKEDILVEAGVDDGYFVDPFVRCISVQTTMKAMELYASQLCEQKDKEIQGLTTRIGELMNPYQCKCNCNLDDCANEVCWDLQECQGTKEQLLAKDLAACKSLLGRCKEELASLKEYPHVDEKTINELLTELDSTLKT